MYLNCHTGFSFKYGTLPIETLFKEAQRCGVKKLVLTEINNTASYLEMLRIRDKNLPRENGPDGYRVTKFGEIPYQLDIAVGIEFREGNEFRYIAIAKNNRGFENVNRFLSRHNREGKELPPRAPEFDDVFIIYPFGAIEPELLRCNEFIGVRKHELTQFALDTTRHEFMNKYVILQPVTFLPPVKKEKKFIYKDYNAHRLLRSIANNTLLSKLQDHQCARRNEFMLPEEKLESYFSNFPELAVNTSVLLDQCSITCELGKDKNKLFYRNSLKEDINLLREKTAGGYAMRYGNDQTIWDKHIEKELAIIEKKNFTSYYLISYDLILFAKSQGYDFVGRGSGANSTVAYCLGITN
jgi:DNA polymerase III alpha subunit